ncbi:hypothetical protein Tco_0573162 [Tanacetum coccineum]
MSDSLRDIYRALESRYVHEGRTIDPSFYNDLSDDSVARFTAIGFDCLLSLDEQICPRFIFKFYKTKLERDSNNHFSIQFIINNHHFNLSLAQIAELTHLLTKAFASTLMPRKIDNPSTLPTSSSEGCTSLGIDETKALKDDPNMSKKQRETRGMFKNLGWALHNIARMLKTRGMFKNLGRALHNIARMSKKGCR